jgi:hypothetical protein
MHHRVWVGELGRQLPNVWNNDLADPSFGITSKIFLDQLTPGGARVDSLEVRTAPRTACPRRRVRW